jgi:hypothetical protein
LLLPRQVSILVFEIQSLAGCRLPHGGSWLPGQFAMSGVDDTLRGSLPTVP